MHILQSRAAESFDACYAEIQLEKYALACVLKRVISARLGQWAESSLVVLYLAFFFFLVKNLCMCAEVEDEISFNTDKSNRGNNRCG